MEKRKTFLDKCCEQFIRSVTVPRFKRLPVLKRVGSSFVRSSVYSIDRNFEEFQSDNLLRSGVDMTKKISFHESSSIEDLDNVNKIVNEILK